MSRVVVQRPARLHPPRVSAGEITLDPPPTLTRDEGGAANWVQYLLPALGSMGSLLFVVTNPKPLFIVGGLVFAAVAVVGGVATNLTQRRGQRRRSYSAPPPYPDYLARATARARGAPRRPHGATP